MVQGRTNQLARVVLIGTLGLLTALGVLGIRHGDNLEVLGTNAPRQMVWIVISLLLLLLAARFPYRRLKGLSYPMFLGAVALLVAVYFFPARQGARRWIPLGPITLQPSELAKVAYILALSQYLMYRENHRTLWGLIPPFLMTLVPVLLILKEPDLGTSLLFFPVLYAVLFTAGAKRWHLLATILAGMAVLPLLWSVMSGEQKSRVTAVFNQHDDGTPDPGDGYHLHQSKQLLALGGVWGSALAGPAVDDPAAYRLPAARTDFIYCLIGERWGLAGTLGTLALFGAFFAAGLHVAAATRDPFGRLLAVGVVSLLAAQVIINTSMTVGLMPITGLTLPLMSYGGSSLLTTAIGLGLLLSVARDPGFDVAGQPFSFRNSNGNQRLG